MAEKKGPLTTAKYTTALARNRQMARALGIDATMTKYKLDALVAPTSGPAGLIDLVNGDSGGGTSPSTVTSVAGYPHITVPDGFYRGLPVGLSFFGRAWSEPTLIKLAYAYEQATKHRKPPALPGHRGRQVAPAFRPAAPTGSVSRVALLGHWASPADDAEPCRHVKQKDRIVTLRLALPLRIETYGGRHMLMFKRSQIYIGLGLAAVVELLIRAVAR